MTMAPRVKTDAVIIIFDTGQSVGEKCFDDGSTFFEKSRECISWILKRKIISVSKDLVCLLLTGTDEESSVGDLNDSLCKNVNVKFDFQLASWDMLNYIDNEVKVSEEVSDWAGALAVSVKKLKSLEECYNVSNKTVVIFSDLKDTFTDTIDYSFTNIKDMNLEITVIGPDYISLILENNGQNSDQPSSKKRRMEAEISHQKKENSINGEKLLHLMWDRLGDLVRITDFDSALRQLSSYSMKTVRAIPWNCVMDVGDVKISIQVFKKIDRKIPLRANLKCVKPGDSSNQEGSSQSTFSDVVRDKIMYYKHVEQDTNETKDIPVGQNDVIPGFRYGKSVIPYSDEDKSVLGYKPGKKCFSILGFTNMDNVPYYVLAGEGSYIVVPRENDEKSEVALSALIQAMSQTSNVAIVRRVYSDDRGLSLGVLYPVVEEGGRDELNHKECLVFIELGYDEDVRTVRLPRLRTMKKRINPPQYKIIDELIERMDLMNVQSGNQGETYEAFDLCSRHETKNQFFQHCLVHKALYPNKPLPKTLPAHCEKYVTQLHSLDDEDVFDEKLFELFSWKRRTDDNTCNANLDAANLYKFSTCKEKTAMNCFKRLFTLHKYPPVEDIKNLIELSVREFHFDVEDIVKAFLHCTKAARQVEPGNLPDNYNFWLRKIRNYFGIKGEFIETFWNGVIEDNLGLITSEEHKGTYINKEDADSFINSLTPKEEVQREERRRKM